MTNFLNLKVGDTAYADFGRGTIPDMRVGEVINVSPTGVIKVRFNFSNNVCYSFMPDGRERGYNGWYPVWLKTEEQYNKLRGVSDRARAARKANEAIKDCSTFTQPSAANEATKAAIIATLEEAIALVRAVPTEEE